MRKTLLTLIVVAATLALTMAAPLPVQGQAAPQQKKEIKDPAEYNAYMAAVQATDPNQKAAALEGFLNQYPNSVMKSDALEMLMGTYQQAGNAAKMQDTAARLLQADPNNIRGLLISALLAKNSATQSGSDQAKMQQYLQQAQQYSEQGMKALQAQTTPPEGVSAADFQKQQTQFKGLFNNVLGWTYLQQKDYAKAAQYLGEFVAANPTDLESTYQLAVAMLEQKPINPMGLWYGARAVSLSNNNAAVNKYVQARYQRYHGDDEGYQGLLQAAAASPTPPADFKIAPAPTPAEQAAKLVATKKVSEMSFDEIQLVLTSGNQQASDRVWGEIKDKPIAMLGTLIAGSPDKLSIAGTVDDIDAKKADIELTMVGPIPAKLMPEVGKDVKFQGNPVSYEANPFMVHMEKGTLIGVKEQPKAPPKKPAAGKRRVPPKR